MGLGRVERFEQLLDTARIQADAGVLHQQFDAVAVLDLRLNPERSRPVFDARHGISRIQQQVQDDLLKLYAIAVDSRQSFREVRLQDRAAAAQFGRRESNHFLRRFVQVERLLASNTFHASEVLRRLLRFLADKTFSGEAEDLKEYSIGLDALGKPPTYDPRQDAAVRLQASRLRQKLEDYYRNEGKSDSLVIELPKGRFKIVWHLNGDMLPVAAAPLATTRDLP